VSHSSGVWNNSSVRDNQRVTRKWIARKYILPFRITHSDTYALYIKGWRRAVSIITKSTIRLARVGRIVVDVRVWNRYRFARNRDTCVVPFRVFVTVVTVALVVGLRRVVVHTYTMLAVVAPIGTRINVYTAGSSGVGFKAFITGTDNVFTRINIQHSRVFSGCITCEYLSAHSADTTQHNKSKHPLCGCESETPKSDNK
jgi:hypothetical protein